MKKLILYIIFPLIYGIYSYGATLSDLNINSVITQQTVTIIKEVIEKNKKTKQVAFSFNSKGGSLLATVDIIDLIQEAQKNGYTFKCFLYKAGSGAASIFAQCDIRTSFNNSELGQHKSGNPYFPYCLDECLTVDLKRVKKEAENMGMSVENFYYSLPRFDKPFKKWEGKEIFESGLSNFHNSTKIVLKKKLK